MSFAQNLQVRVRVKLTLTDRDNVTCHTKTINMACSIIWVADYL